MNDSQIKEFVRTTGCTVDISNRKQTYISEIVNVDDGIKEVEILGGGEAREASYFDYLLGRLRSNNFPKEGFIVTERLNAVGLEEDVLHKFPSELSGGMKKRVGLARTLMAQPKILIYDEPTTGLDPITARLIRDLIKRTHDKYGTTTIVISHDVEIFKYASHVAMLHKGKIVCKCEAQSVWDNENPYLYQFIRGLPEGPIKQPSVISK